MSDERRDDEIIGRALSRAIETIDVNQTPYERSRIATAPTRRSIFGLWQMATAAAAIVLALAIGSWLTRPTEPGPVAGSPTPTIAPATQPGATQTPAPSGATVSTRVFFVRDLLPPVSAIVPSGGAHIAADRVVERITAAHAAPPSSVPAGAVNPLGVVPLRADGTSISAKINGDTAEVEFDPSGGWGVHGAAQVQALVQQLVYVITEEPGIRKARITEKGKASAVIDGLIVDRPLSREDVTDYSFRAAVGKANAITWGGDDSLPHVGARLAGYDIQDGTRATLFLEGRDSNGQKADLPSFTAWLEQGDDTTPIGAKYTLYVEFQWNGGGNSNGAADVRIFDQTPLRAVTTNGNNVFRIELDDARPWRVSYISNSNIAIEIGGNPLATSDRIAVSAPKAGDRVSGQVRVVGSARVFEANVVWRLKDASGKAVANGHFLTNLGTSAVWGQFDQRLAIPATVHGNVTLELYEASAKDGSEQGLVAVPLTVP